jgi:hypothetical protein
MLPPIAVPLVLHCRLRNPVSSFLTFIGGPQQNVDWEIEEKVKKHYRKAVENAVAHMARAQEKEVLPLHCYSLLSVCWWLTLGFIRRRQRGAQLKQTYSCCRATSSSQKLSAALSSTLLSSNALEALR